MAGIKTSLTPYKACSLLLSLNNETAKYEEYQSGVYECSSSFTEQGDTEQFTYSQRARGVKDYVVEQKISLLTTSLKGERLAARTKAQKIAMEKYLSLAEIAAFNYGEPLPDAVLEKKGLIEGVFETAKYTVKIKEKSIRKDLMYREIYFIGK